jgi:uncharacterized protein YbgA (DUF1722 family)/uncharacterized protein YbbK (DUF523 family)
LEVSVGPERFLKPRVVVSRCLGFEACRYNGEMLTNRFVHRLGKHVEVVTVCPEMEIGLGVPRDPIRIVGAGDDRRLLQPSTDRDLTEAMHGFSESFCGSLPDVDGFILKSRSPSCAVTDSKVHAAREGTAPLGKGPGLFAATVLERFPSAAIEDEGRLTNFRIREHFLTRIFTFAAFRKLRRHPTMGGLVRFHSERKLLYMALNQTRMRTMGRIVANHARLPIGDVLDAYEQELVHAFARMARLVSHINVLMHAFGYFSKELTATEKAHILELLERYRNQKVPLSAAIAVVSSWIARFGEDYLASQVYFRPFPEDLVEITDSGKVRGK